MQNSLHCAERVVVFDASGTPGGLGVLRGVRDSICHCWMGFIDQKACIATLQVTFQGRR